MRTRTDDLARRGDRTMQRICEIGGRAHCAEDVLARCRVCLVTGAKWRLYLSYTHAATDHLVPPRDDAVARFHVLWLRPGPLRCRDRHVGDGGGFAMTDEG